MVWHEGDCFDHLRPGEKSDRPTPVTDPRLLGLVRHRGNALHAAFWNVRGDRRDAENPLAAVAEDVDERSDVGGLVLDERGEPLLFLERLGGDRNERELFDAEARFDLLGAISKKLREQGNVARRLGGARADRLYRVVDLVDDEICPTGAEAALLEFAYELDDEATDVFVDRFRSAYRFLEVAEHLDDLGRPDGIDRLGLQAAHLVETTTDLGAETQCERCPWCRRQFADGLEPHGRRH